ncbi:MAG: hypothetical protein K2Q21_09555 [Chitinophagaceae bacterium]|nr:hypothetical protein [Chitinophagaceae bacterium]
MKKTIILLILFCFSNFAKADWPVGKKRTNLTPSFTYYYTDRVFGADGKVRVSANGDKFTSKMLGLYGVSGLSRRVDLVYNIPISMITAQNIFEKNTKTGVGDVSVGLAYHTPSKDLKSFFTVKGQLIIPMYSNTSIPHLGYGSMGAQISANYSFSPKKGSYLVAEGAYSRYFGQIDGPNQYLFNLTYGKELSNALLISITYNNLISVSADKTFSTNLNANKDFTIGKLSGAIGKKISRTVTPYLQTYYTIYGRNSGLGFGFSFFVMIKIP